jgi:hypothetical protein
MFRVRFSRPARYQAFPIPLSCSLSAPSHLGLRHLVIAVGLFLRGVPPPPLSGQRALIVLTHRTQMFSQSKSYDKKYLLIYHLGLHIILTDIFANLLFLTSSVPSSTLLS